MRNKQRKIYHLCEVELQGANEEIQELVEREDVLRRVCHQSGGLRRTYLFGLQGSTDQEDKGAKHTVDDSVASVLEDRALGRAGEGGRTAYLVFTTS